MRAQMRKVKPSIIVVEDEEALRRMLRSILIINGYRVLVAGTNNDALRICTQFRRPIDLMITEVKMPGFSGFVLADEVARNRPKMPILFISEASTAKTMHSETCFILAESFSKNRLREAHWRRSSRS